MTRELRLFGQSLLDCVNEIFRIGEFKSVVKKDCTDLSRRVVLLSHLFEEIRDFNNGGGGESGGSLSQECLSCLGDLLLALQGAKRLLQLGHSASKIFLVLEGKRIATQFQYVAWQLEKVLRVIPYDYFEISDEVREQVELVRAQLRRAIERNEPSDGNNHLDTSRVLSQPQEKDTEVHGLTTTTSNLEVEGYRDLNHELQELLDMGVNGNTKHNSGQVKCTVNSLRNLALFNNVEANEADPKGAYFAKNSLEENKKPDSLVIPDDFRCPISLELMRDPVIVATGQTYERSFIQRWIDCGHRTCPKTQQKLPHLILTPNYVMRSLITQWCEAHGVEQPQRSAQSRIRKGDGSFHEVSGDRVAIDALVRKLSSRSPEEQRSAAAEIRLLAKRSTDNRILIAEAGAVPVLVNLLSSGESRTQEHAVTAILNLSIYENNKGLIVLAGAVPPIVEVLRLGNMEARENAAATLFSLSLVDENKITIGASGAISALVELLLNGSQRGKKDAATALFNLCIYPGNKARAVRAGILVPLMKMLTDANNGMIDEALTILSVLASHQEGKAAIGKANCIPVLVDLVRTGLPFCINLLGFSSNLARVKRVYIRIWGLFCFTCRMSIFPKSDSIQIREVWADNLEEEFDLIREFVDDYPYIAMDTEFPGIVLRPVGNFKTSSDYHYRTLKANVDMLKLIQLGLTFSDEEGNLPTCETDKFCVWQFNFREFNVQEDVYANDSIELLMQSGIDFPKNNDQGIDTQRFGELLMSSGIVLNDNVHWVTFHSGYDFGYLLKLLTCQNLPETPVGFFSLINMYFPTVYDIKHLMKFCNSLHGGLNKLAELLDVERIGICHQAGSDSLLTSCTYRKLKESFFNGSTERYAGVLYGLGIENGQSTH